MEWIILFIIGCLIYALWDYWGTIFQVALWCLPVLLIALYLRNCSISPLRSLSNIVLLIFQTAGWIAAACVCMYIGIGLGAWTREIPDSIFSWILSAASELGEGTVIPVITNIIDNCFAAVPQFLSFFGSVAVPSLGKGNAGLTVLLRLFIAVGATIFISYSVIEQETSATSPNSPYTVIDTFSTWLTCVAGAVAGMWITYDEYHSNDL